MVEKVCRRKEKRQIDSLAIFSLSAIKGKQDKLRKF
jgi:hypothetical protein